MSSYGSMSPSDEGFDRYEPPYFCQPSHQGSPMDGGVYWPATNGEAHEFDTQDMYHDTTHYIGRGYGYEEMQMAGNEPYDTYHHNMAHNFVPNNPGLDCDLQSLPLRYDRPAPPSFVRVAKRRTTANKKERRRTQSINTAFSDLRDCIPNVPPDTKLSKMVRKRSQSINSAFSSLRQHIPNVLPDTKMTKIKTLRLATSYISYLLKVLETDGEPAGGFRADLHHTPPRRRTVEGNQTGGGPPGYFPPDDILDRVAALLGSTGEGFTVRFGGDAVPEIIGDGDGRVETAYIVPVYNHNSSMILIDSPLPKNPSTSMDYTQISTENPVSMGNEVPANGIVDELQNATAEKRGKGRTGWPQHVWALELKSEQNLQT